MGIIDLDPVEQARAGRFLAHVIPAVLEQHLQGMMSGAHPLLAPLPSADGGTTVH